MENISTTLVSDLKCSPFLRWAGGKKWLLKHIKPMMPSEFNDYYEPFLGGAAVFFNTRNNGKFHISDLNEDLITTYKEIRDNLDSVINHLRGFKNTLDDYYKIRSTKYNKPSERAAQFIYLNKTSFNGIYRVNSTGGYNVPYGYRENIDIVDENNLRNCCTKLQDVTISCNDFDLTLSDVKEGDFCFIDPPYTTAHENNGFIAYNQKLFSIEDQYRLAERLRVINNIGAKYIVTNAFHTSIAKIYENTGDLHKIERMSTIGGRGAKREVIHEYVIKNY